MTSKIVVNNIQADAGVSTVTFGSEISASRVTTSSGQFTVGTGASVYSPATNVLSLGTNNTEKVRIDSSGNFNLVNTAGIMTAFKYETPALINNHFKSQSTTAGAYVRMYAAASSGQWDIYGNGANLRFSDNASSGNIQMDRPLSMNSQNIIMSSGYGIDFSATANSSGTMTSELLSDYEEGTFTPTLTFGGGSTGITYSNRNGSYTKIGKVVVVRVGVLLSNKGSSTGTAAITGLPFTVESISYADATGCFGWSNMSGLGGGPLVAVCSNAATQFLLWSGNATSRIITSDTNYANSTEFYGTITYTTTS
jgi:hypothetical protein